MFESGRSRLAVYPYIIGFALLAVTCAVLYYLSSEMARCNAMQRMAGDVEFRAEAVQNWLNTKTQVLEILRATIEEVVGDKPIPTQFLSAYKHDPELRNVVLGLMDGTIASGLLTPPPPEPLLAREWFKLTQQHAGKGSVIGPFFPSLSGPGQVFTISTPLLHRNGTIRGGLAFVIPQSALAAFAQKMPSDGKRVLIITSGKHVLVPLDPSGNAAAFAKLPGAAQLYAESRGNHKGLMELPLDGAAHVFAYAAIRGTDWILAVYAPKDVVLGDFAPLQNLFLVFCVVTALCIGYLIQRAWKNDSYKNLSQIDQLTQIGNRTAYEQAFRNLRRKADFPVALLICDMDNLKKVNDAMGHEAGDRQLQRMSAVLRGCLRGDDSIFRLGGDEFAILLLGTVARTATLLIRRITRTLEENSLAHPNRPSLEVSIGVALALDPEELESLYRRADEAMYEQKIARKSQAKAPAPLIEKNT